MAIKCPNCGLTIDDDVKFCPACGNPLMTDKPPAQPPDTAEQRRVFVLRKQNYGDTAQFEDTYDRKESVEDIHAAAKTGVSLYISIFAAVLSVTAIVLVILFAVIPANRQATTAPTEAPVPPTAAPATRPPEPLITGVYDFVTIETADGSDLFLLSPMLRVSRLEMAGDYTGSLMIGERRISRVTLDEDSHTAVFLGTDCTYSFDATVLKIEYLNMTLVFKKSKQ